MLTEILQYLKNWFEKFKLFSEFVISDGIVSFSNGDPVPLSVGQYFRIIGSVFNDGVHEYGNSDLIDEKFSGSVWALAIPLSVLQLAKEIEDWTEKNSDAINSPYQSESFGGYSYSLKNGSAGSGVLTWKSQFADRLAPWRKL